MKFFKSKMSVDSLPKNHRKWTLDNICNFFHVNLDVIKQMEKDKVLPVSSHGFGLSTVAEELLSAYMTERIIDLDELKSIDESKNERSGSSNE